MDSLRPLKPEFLAEYQKLIDVRMTYHSNAIEGNTLSQSETQLVLEKGITIGGKTVAEHLEAIGHHEAIGFMNQLAEDRNRIGEREIKQIHALVVRGTMPEEQGKYRTVNVKAAGTEHTYPDHLQVPSLMSEFSEQILNSSLHPVEQAIKAHYDFVSIHPFRDGNGRTGRLLMNLFLLRAGYPSAILRVERRSEYINALVHAQTHVHDYSQLKMLIAEELQNSLEEVIALAS